MRRSLLAPTLIVTSVLALTGSACDTAGSQPDAGAVPVMPVEIEGLGSLSFPNYGSEAAQEPFRRGVLLLHSFEFEPAAEAFREAQTRDADFALAYWGEAMSYNHPLWRQKDEEAAAVALSRLGPGPEERRAKAGSDREAMYLDAVEALYSEGDKSSQDHAYMTAMQRLHETYPEDDEARAFYALSILGSTDGSRDFATYMRAAATALPVFEANPNHPGAAHYIIHSFDDPIHAPLGLPAARAYADIAPDAAHAQHMTTHIFVALGMWDDVVSGNIRARDTQDAELAGRGRRPNLCGHYSTWLHYGHLMRGDAAEAEALMVSCHGRMAQGPSEKRPSEEGPSEEERSYFVSARARHVLDTEDWSLASRWTTELPADSGSLLGYEFTNAFAALRQGDPEPARVVVAGTGTLQSPYQALHLDELRGLLALHAGDVEAGLEILREAAETEASLPFAFGPPRVLKPTWELLGEELLRLGRSDEARSAFQRAVERNPGRTPSVRGLQRAEDS